MGIRNSRVDLVQHAEMIRTDGNSQKNHNNQPNVLDDICAQLRSGDRNVTGVMIESHINEGRQDVPPGGPAGLRYGVSITDACVDWQTTVGMLDRLNAVRVPHLFYETYRVELSVGRGGAQIGAHRCKLQQTGSHERILERNGHITLCMFIDWVVRSL